MRTLLDLFTQTPKPPIRILQPQTRLCSSIAVGTSTPAPPPLPPLTYSSVGTTWLERYSPNYRKTQKLTVHPSSIGAPVAGFYWPTERIYSGEGSADIDYPFDAASLSNFADYWGSVPESPFLAESLLDSGFLDSQEIFFVESLSDSVQLSLHLGISEEPMSDGPQYDYVEDWTKNMTAKLLKLDTLENGCFAAFSPSCYIHTSFTSVKPHIDEVSFYDTFHDFAFSNNNASKREVASCPFDCNPTCP